MRHLLGNEMEKPKTEIVEEPEQSRSVFEATTTSWDINLNAMKILEWEYKWNSDLFHSFQFE